MTAVQQNETLAVVVVWSLFALSAVSVVKRRAARPRDGALRRAGATRRSSA
jgi:hypothetical protein